MLSLTISLSLSLLPFLSSAELYYFSFGDSYVDTGFDINGLQPSPGNPLGNPAYGTAWTPSSRGSFSGGPNHVDFLTTELNNTVVYNYNFAYGGATISSSLQPPQYPDMQTLEQQVTQEFNPKYSAPGAGPAPWASDNAVFSVCIGINDIQFSYLNPSKPFNAFVDAYIGLLNTLYTYGARKFLVIGVPPFERSPAAATFVSPDILTATINNFNGYLANQVIAFQQAHPDVQTSIYDLHAYMTRVLDAPAAYGFADATCGGNGQSKCVWWDASILHTTSTFQQLMAQDMHDSGALARLGW